MPFAFYVDALLSIAYIKSSIDDKTLTRGTYQMAEAIKSTKPRKPQVQKPIFAVIQVLDEQGESMAFDKSRINVVIATKDAGVALDAMDSGVHKNATYKKIDVS